MNLHARSLRLVLAIALCSACDGTAPADPDGGAADAFPSADSSVTEDTPHTDGGSLDEDAPSGCSEADLALLEGQMASILDTNATNTEITSNPVFTVLLEADDGRRFDHSHGDSTATTEYESASTSKWVTAVVILDLVDRGVLSLDTRAHDVLPFWTETEVDLRDLLSFTSGFSDEPFCINLPSSDFAECVQRMFDDNVATAPPPGTDYHYSGTHLQIAGLMAIVASGVAGWRELFEDFQARTGLFPTGRYDLPSLTNPRLAGGMTWTANEYLGFLGALHRGEVLSPAMRTELLRNQRGDAVVTASPAFNGLHEDWSYGLGNWLECPTAPELGTYDCGEGHRNSSAGAYGGYPFIDSDERYLGIVAQQGRLGTGDEGVRLFRTIQDLAARWANRRCTE